MISIGLVLNFLNMTKAILKSTKAKIFVSEKLTEKFLFSQRANASNDKPAEAISATIAGLKPLKFL